MIFSLDTCILLDILLPDPSFGLASRESLKEADKIGKLVICPIVYAELCPQFSEHVPLTVFLKESNIRMFPLSTKVLWKAGMAWKHYISSGGQRKERILPDFLIGAFSSLKADAMITRDKDFYKTYFDVKIFNKE